MKKIKSILSGLFLLIAVSLSAQEVKTGKIFGTILDRTTNEPLIGANILVIGSTRGASADVNGTYAFEKIAVGTYNLKVSMLGYEPQIKTDVVVSPSKPVQINFELEQNTVQMKEDIVVEASYFYKPKETPTSLQALSYEEIRRAPGAAADISRMIQNMPGVVQTTDSRNDLIVRGGSPAENLNVIDGFEIPNLNHFGSQGSSGGPIGMIQTEFISEATFLSGGFPSTYGDKLSSVLDIKLREGNREKLSGSFDLSMAGAGVILEGPITSNTTYMLNARISYLDLFNKTIGLTAVPKYTNYNGKITHKIDPQNDLNFIFLAGIDDIHFTQDESEKDSTKMISEDVRSGGYQYLAGTSWRHIFSKNGYSNLYFWTTKNVFDNKGLDLIKDADNPNGNNLLFENKSTESQVGTKYTASLFVNNQIEINTGISAKTFNINYDIFAKADTNSLGKYEGDLVQNSTFKSFKGEGFFQTVYKPTDQFSITAGGLINYFDAIDKKFAFDPRLGISYEVNPLLKLNASVGIFHQSPEFIWIYGANSVNSNLEFIKATHTVLGFDYYPDSDIKVTVEGYVKLYDNYPVSAVNPSVSLANKGDDFGPSSLGALKSEGTGKSMGIDFFVQKKLTDHLYGLVSYSFSHTKNKASDGVERSGAFDIPHVFTISGGYKLNEEWEFSSKFRYVSGRPYTPIDLAASAQTNSLRYQTNPDAINSVRYPDYFRLDLRFDHRSYYEKFTVVSFFEIENVTNRQNTFAYFWNRNKKAVDTAYQWAFFPVGGVKIEF